MSTDNTLQSSILNTKLDLHLHTNRLVGDTSTSAKA